MSIDGSVQQARVNVIVHRAESLVGLSAHGSSNPFVSVSVGSTVLSTSVVQNSTNPNFESTFNFPECPIPTILTLRVFHKEENGPENPLGSATLTLFSPSPMVRRSVQLSHGGSVLLSQKARDGCGSLDVSYEVVAAAPQGETIPDRRKSADSDLPSFLRDDATAENFTSAFTAATQLSPPSPVSAVPKPPEFGVVPPPPSVSAVPKPPEFGVVPPPPSVSAVPKPPEFGVVPPPPSVSAVTKPPEFGVVPPPPSVSAVPKPPEFGVVPPPPSVSAVPKPPEFGVAPPPPSVSAVPKPPEFGVVPPAVPASVVVPSSFGQLVSPVHSAGQGPLPLSEGGSSSQPHAVSGALAVTDSSDTSPPPSSSNAHETRGSSDSTKHGYSSVSSPNSSKHTQQQKLRGESLSSAALPSSSIHTSSRRSSAALPAESIQTPKGQLSSKGGEVAQSSSGSVFGVSSAKDSDKLQKKVKIATSAKERPTSAGALTVTKPPIRQHGESGRGRSNLSVSPTRDPRHTSSSQGVRASPHGLVSAGKRLSNGTAQGAATAPMVKRCTSSQSPPIYQYPEELLTAASLGDVAVFQRLREEDPQLSRGFEKVRDYSGRTILHIAAWYGHVQVLKVLLQPTPVAPLLELRALRSVNGNTILHSAAQGGRVDAVQWLRFSTAAASLIGQRNSQGITATDCAREAGFMNVAVMLAET